MRGWKEEEKSFTNSSIPEILAGAAAILFMEILIVFVIALYGAGYRPWTNRQTAAHEAAQLLREAGIEEDHYTILALQTLWWADYVEPSAEVEKPADGEETPIWDLVGITWEDYCTMCYCNFREAGPGCSPEHQRSQAAVVWNRVKSPRFPDTVVDVICQPRQFSPHYVRSTLDGIPEENIEAVNAVLRGEWLIPEDCVWQAQFAQGTYTWATYFVNSDGYKSTTYICGGYR